MNCTDCISRMEQLADRELSEVEVVEVRHHLDTCPPCLDRYHFEVDLKRLVRVCCEADKAPPELRAKLREILF
jgi:mycothiol system anti-sigma-R factor